MKELKTPCLRVWIIGTDGSYLQRAYPWKSKRHRSGHLASAKQNATSIKITVWINGCAASQKLRCSMIIELRGWKRTTIRKWIVHDSFCEEWEFRDNLLSCRYFWSASLDMPTQRSNVSGRPRTNFPRKLLKENITSYSCLAN